MRDLKVNQEYSGDSPDPKQSSPMKHSVFEQGRNSEMLQQQDMRQFWRGASQINKNIKDRSYGRNR